MTTTQTTTQQPATGGLKAALTNPKNLLRLSQSVLSLMAVLAFIAVVHPDVRAEVRGTLRADFRTVISTAKGDLSGDGSMFTVAKVKTRDNIYLEIFQTIATEGLEAAPRLVERIELADTRDAFFNFNGQATNLAIDDVDGDGRVEILAPTFDRNLVGRLNVFQYNDATQDFRKVIR